MSDDDDSKEVKDYTKRFNHGKWMEKNFPTTEKQERELRWLVDPVSYEFDGGAELDMFVRFLEGLPWQAFPTGDSVLEIGRGQIIKKVIKEMREHLDEIKPEED